MKTIIDYGKDYPFFTVIVGLVPSWGRGYFSWIPRRYYDVSDGGIEMFGLRSKWLWVTYYREYKG